MLLPAVSPVTVTFLGGQAHVSFPTHLEEGPSGSGHAARPVFGLWFCVGINVAVCVAASVHHDRL